GAERSVDRVAQAARGREIRTVQVQDDAVAEMKSRRDLALDGCPGWNAADARHVDRDARAVAAADAEAADDEIALRDRIDLPVRAAERRHQQASAPQARRVADRRDRDVDRLAGLRERRQVRVHHHRGNVAELQVRARRNRHAELGEHVPQALRRERRRRRLVARAVEADDEAVAHQLVRAHARDGGEILDAFLGARGERRGEQRAERHEPTHMRYEAARGGREAQNGHSGLEKKRLSQPGALDDATTPVPPYATCASAICVESTVLSGAISTGRTMPRKRIYSSPWL